MEDSLIKLAQAGDLNAFSKLIDENKNFVYSLVLKTINNTQDAEEVAQDVFVKAFSSIKQFNQKSKFSTWLYKIAYFTSINHLRKQKQLSSSLNLIEIESEDDSALDNINDSEKSAIINEALGYLRPIDRSLISMYYLEELSIKEIQEITTLSNSNIKVKLSRIRKQLNGILNTMLKGELNSFLKS